MIETTAPRDVHDALVELCLTNEEVTTAQVMNRSGWSYWTTRKWLLELELQGKAVSRVYFKRHVMWRAT